MKGFISNNIFFFLVVFLLFSCEPIPQELPPMTHEGRNTIGYFLEDGILIGGVFDGNDEIYQSENGNLNVEHEFSYKKYMGQITASHVLKFEFRKDSSDGLFYFNTATYSEYGYDLGTIDEAAPGFLVIDYQDSINKIIAGTFELNFLHLDTFYYDEDSILFIDTSYYQTLSRGRFDIAY